MKDWMEKSSVTVFCACIIGLPTVAELARNADAPWNFLYWFCAVIIIIFPILCVCYWVGKRKPKHEKEEIEETKPKNAGKPAKRSILIVIPYLLITLSVIISVCLFLHNSSPHPLKASELNLAITDEPTLFEFSCAATVDDDNPRIELFAHKGDQIEIAVSMTNTSDNLERMYHSIETTSGLKLDEKMTIETPRGTVVDDVTPGTIYGTDVEHGESIDLTFWVTAEKTGFQEVYVLATVDESREATDGEIYIYVME